MTADDKAAAIAQLEPQVEQARRAYESALYDDSRGAAARQAECKARLHDLRTQLARLQAPD